MFNTSLIFFSCWCLCSASFLMSPGRQTFSQSLTEERVSTMKFLSRGSNASSTSELLGPAADLPDAPDGAAML